MSSHSDSHLSFPAAEQALLALWLAHYDGIEPLSFEQRSVVWGGIVRTGNLLLREAAKQAVTAHYRVRVARLLQLPEH